MPPCRRRSSGVRSIHERIAMAGQRDGRCCFYLKKQQRTSLGPPLMKRSRISKWLNRCVISTGRDGCCTERCGFMRSGQVLTLISEINARFIIAHRRLALERPDSDALGQVLLQKGIDDHRWRHDQYQPGEGHAPVAAILADNGDIGQSQWQGTQLLRSLA